MERAGEGSKVSETGEGKQTEEEEKEQGGREGTGSPPAWFTLLVDAAKKVQRTGRMGQWAPGGLGHPLLHVGVAGWARTLTRPAIPPASLSLCRKQ